MAIKLRGPKNYSSNGRVKTLHMYSFYKNTLTFNCCFSNLSLLCLLGGCCRARFLAGRARATCVEPITLKVVGSSLPPPPFHLLLMLSSREGLSDFIWGLLLIKKTKTNCLTSLQSQPSSRLFGMIHSGIPEEMDSQILPLKVAEPVHFRNSKGLGLGTEAEHADVPLPFSSSDASGLESKPSSQWPRGRIFNFRLHPHPPHLRSSSIKQACLFSEGKRSRWQLIEKQQFAFDKGVL